MTPSRIIADVLIHVAACKWLDTLCLSSFIGRWFEFIWNLLYLVALVLLVVGFACRVQARRLNTAKRTRRELRLARKNARAARDLQDSLLQTIEASKMVADDALDGPADAEQMQRTMSRLSQWLGQATKEGLQAIESLHAASPQESTLQRPSRKRLRHFLRAKRR